MLITPTIETEKKKKEIERLIEKEKKSK